MAQSSGNGKNIDQSTDWSEWKWDSRGYWYSQRTGPNGVLEYGYRYPESQQTVAPQTPRYAGPNIITQQNYSYRGTHSMAAISAGSQPGVQFDSSNIGPGQPGASRTQDYTYMQKLLAPYPQTLAVPSRQSSHKGQQLDNRFQRIPDRDPNGFWIAGRVFKMLWVEAAREQDNVIKPSPSDHTASYQTSTYSNPASFAEIRWYVILKTNHGSSLCSPIHTYNKQATLKSNLPHVDSHTIIYTTDVCPEMHSKTLSDGRVITETLSLDPIKVDSELNDPDGQLSPLSRLNYSKVYTVEHYSKVMKIGMVADKSMDSLRQNSQINDYERTPQPSKQRRNRHKDKGSGRSRN